MAITRKAMVSRLVRNTKDEYLKTKHCTEKEIDEFGEWHTPLTLIWTLAREMLLQIRQGNGSQAFAAANEALEILEREIPQFVQIDKSRQAQAKRYNANLRAKERGEPIEA